ncbi:hypothetical protein KEJ36_05200 [Candidatus Bathyarchaeota archaeon]|nr:hypothetical protein [Candidatus Bathyarchaeota archaeon]MBS7628180.1 hypothetical protein [Candidatus Bathyarchaeota archaeon]
MEVIEARVQVSLNPTEDREKVLKAVRNLVAIETFEELALDDGRKLLLAKTDEKGLERFRELLVAERIRDAARRILKLSLRGDTFTVYLNKQVAFAGHVSFCEERGESPLGAIKLEVKVRNSREFLDWVAPSSKR